MRSEKDGIGLLAKLELFNNKIFFNCSIDSEGLTKYLETFLGMR